MTPEKRKQDGPDLGVFWTAPNVLSMVRLVLVFPVFWLIVTDGRLLWIMVLILIAIATDYFDGRVARWSHSVSEWGKVLDPLADKMAGGLVVLALVWTGALPTWFVVAILARDITIFIGGIIIGRRTRVVPASMWSGKIAVTAIAVTVLAALLQADPEVLQFCLQATTVLLIWSFIRYLIRWIRDFRATLVGTDDLPEASEGT